MGYFGCRNRAHDYIYEDELTAYEKDGTITQLHTAFSRDQPEKVYVTHLLRQNRDDLWRLLEAGAHVYVCGDGQQMSHDVHRILIDLVAHCGNMSEPKADAYVKDLQLKSRYQQDVWG